MDLSKLSSMPGQTGRTINNAGKSILQLAKEQKLGDDVIKLLQEHGAKE